jgi:hypothetical protein
MRKVLNYFLAMLRNDPKVSLVRVLSVCMFIEASIFLFTKVVLKDLTWQGMALIAFLYGLAFFPKVLQKKYEQINILKDETKRVENSLELDK